MEPNRNEPCTAKELVDHHHAAMRDRRAIELKVFTGAIAVVLLVAKESVDIVTRVQDACAFRWLLSVFLALFLVSYAVGLLAIESRNRTDRMMYTAAEDRMRQGGSGPMEPATECFCRTLWHSWAATVPFLVTTLVVSSVICMVWMLDPNATMITD